MSKISEVEIVEIPKIEDPRGNLAVVEKDLLGYIVKRVYYLFDVPSSAVRGGHSHKEQHETLVALSGSFEVILNDGKEEKTVFLNKPDKGLHIVPGIWRELKNFSSGAICLVFASDVFREADYIRDFEVFKKSKMR